MNAPIPLSDLPERMAPELWQRLLDFTPNRQLPLEQELSDHKTSALCLLNAPHPTAEGVCSEFWSTYPGAQEQQIDIFDAGRDIHDQCRELFSKGELRAEGVDETGLRRDIAPREMTALHPLFATDRIRGRNLCFTNVQVSFHPRTVSQLAVDSCMEWLSKQRDEGTPLKKIMLLYLARRDLGQDLSEQTFNFAYSQVIDRRRGRPKIMEAESTR